MFKVSGIWVSPFEVESALITHPAVLEAAVVPEADPEGLLKPKAFVVLRADANTDGLHEALKEHVKQKIGVWKYPRWIEVVDSLAENRDRKNPAVQVAGWSAVADACPCDRPGARRDAVLRGLSFRRDGQRPSVTMKAGGSGSRRSPGRQSVRMTRIAFGKPTS